MSATSSVPPRVPSLFHSSSPFGRFEAEKNTSPPTAVRELGYEPPFPSKTSPTSSVPSSPVARPELDTCRSLYAVKNSVPSTFVSDSGAEPAEPGLMSRTNSVPAVVPSLFQSS